MVEEFTLQKEEAPFNMAIATLYALRGILDKITSIYSEPFISDDIKQKTKISLVIRFFIDSCPLLEKEEVIDKYRYVLKFKPVKKKIIEKNSSNFKTTQKEKIVYDEELESQLNCALIDLQVELQSNGYYMPPRKDLGRAVSSFR